MSEVYLKKSLRVIKVTLSLLVEPEVLVVKFTFPAITTIILHKQVPVQ